MHQGWKNQTIRQVSFSGFSNMTTLLYCCNVFVLCFLLIRDSTTLSEGETCCLKDGSGGTCKFFTECPASVELFNNGTYPVICGLVKNELIVCCQDEEKKNKKTPSNIPVPSRTPGDISKQKCKEYAQYVYEKVRLPTLSIDPQYATSFECGLLKFNLVIGNDVASTREFPHMAQLGFEENGKVNWVCAGTLISENFILTAGHCLINRQGLLPKIARVGIRNSTELSYMQEIAISECIIYPGYRPRYHDIALLKLSRNVKLNSYARPACLQTEKEIPQTKPLASGWGTIEFDGKYSDVLLKVGMEFFTAEACNNTYLRKTTSKSSLQYGIVDDWMICATITGPLTYACQGDSGGPLQVYHEDIEDVKCMYDIVGVTSFGGSCDLTTNIPDVHTRVSNYIKWIEDTVWPN